MRTVRLTDKKTGRGLMREMGIAESIPSRLFGLMGRRGLKPGTGLYFPRCSSIHMFFMLFAIDVVYVDKALKVEKIVHALKPWRLSWCRGAYGVIEAPPGWADEVGLEVGAQLAFDEPAEQEET